MDNKAAIKELAYLYDKIKDIRSKVAIDAGIKALEQESKTGYWIEHFDESGKWYECNQCHTDWGGPVNYCPNCGVKM